MDGESESPRECVSESERKLLVPNILARRDWGDSRKEKGSHGTLGKVVELAQVGSDIRWRLEHPESK